MRRWEHVWCYLLAGFTTSLQSYIIQEKLGQTFKKYTWKSLHNNLNVSWYFRNPFLVNAPILYPLKTTEDRRFSGVSRFIDMSYRWKAYTLGTSFTDSHPLQHILFISIMPKFHPKKFHFGIKEQVQAKLCVRRSLARDQENSPSAALLPKVICYM